MIKKLLSFIDNEAAMAKIVYKLLNKSLSGWSLNSRSRTNGCNGVQGVGLKSGPILVGTEPGTVVGTAYFAHM